MTGKWVLFLACMLAGLALPMRANASAQQVCEQAHLRQVSSAMLREVEIDSVLGVVVVLSENQAVLCTVIQNCIWATALLPNMPLGGLSRYAGREACGPPSAVWDGSTLHTPCDVTPELSRAFRGMRESVRSIAGAQACVTLGMPAIGGVILASPMPLLILPLPIGTPSSTDQATTPASNQTITSVCLQMVLSLETMRIGLVFTPVCETTTRIYAMAEAILPVESGAGQIAWLAMDPGSNSVGFAIRLNDSLNAVPPSARAWGETLRTDYVAAWLSRVAAAANDNTIATSLATVDDPLPMADRKVPTGRLARWMVAGMHRLGDPSVSVPVAARSAAWMARNLAGGRSILNGTVLRREIAMKIPDLP